MLAEGVNCSTVPPAQKLPASAGVLFVPSTYQITDEEGAEGEGVAALRSASMKLLGLLLLRDGDGAVA